MRLEWLASRPSHNAEDSSDFRCTRHLWSGKLFKPLSVLPYPAPIPSEAWDHRVPETLAPGAIRRSAGAGTAAWPVSHSSLRERDEDLSDNEPIIVSRRPSGPFIAGPAGPFGPGCCALPSISARLPQRCFPPAKLELRPAELTRGRCLSHRCRLDGTSFLFARRA